MAGISRQRVWQRSLLPEMAASGSHNFARAALGAILAVALCTYGSAACAGEDGGREYEEWTTKLNAAIKRKDPSEEVLCVTTIGRRWEWGLTNLPRGTIERVAADSEFARVGDRRTEMLQLLYERRWKRREGQEPSRLWQELSLNLLERGKPEEAADVAAHITDPYALIALQADKRYTRIAHSQFVERNIGRAAANELKWWQLSSQQAPRSLGRVGEVGRQLLKAQRYGDVLSLTAFAIQPGVVIAGDFSSYDDPDQFPWILDVRAKALEALGHDDDAVEVMRRSCNESKHDLISHCLNLALMLAGLGRAEEAQAAVPSLEAASVYGKALGGLVRTMVAAERNDAAALGNALDEVRGHSENYPGILQHALVVAGRQDDAAAVLVSRITNPDFRADALVELQDYADTPAPRQVTRWRRLNKDLRSQADVQRLVAEHGNVARYPIPSLGF